MFAIALTVSEILKFHIFYLETVGHLKFIRYTFCNGVKLLANIYEIAFTYFILDVFQNKQENIYRPEHINSIIYRIICSASLIHVILGL